MATSKRNTKAESTTLLVLVVDRSGSMESIREDMEGGIKALLSEQGTEEGPCLVTLAQFDDAYELVTDGVPVAELGPYRLVPRGSTALLDAIGRTIVHVKGRLEAIEPSHRPGHVLVAVISDGMENSSQEWSRVQVMDTVKARISEGWDFTFLGANQDAIQEGGRMGVSADSSLKYEASPEGARQAFSAASGAIGRKRRGESKSLEYTEEDRRRAAGF